MQMTVNTIREFEDSDKMGLYNGMGADMMGS